METRPSSPRDDLKLIADARAAAADRLITPWWYHPILGLLIGGYAVAFAIGGTLVRLAAVVLLFAALALLVTGYRRVTGVWVSGFEAGPATRWAYVVGGGYAVSLVVGLLLYEVTGHVWPVFLIALVVTVSTIVVGRRFDRLLRAYLRGSSA